MAVQAQTHIPPAAKDISSHLKCPRLFVVIKTICGGRMRPSIKLATPGGYRGAV